MEIPTNIAQATDRVEPPSPLPLAERDIKTDSPFGFHYVWSRQPDFYKKYIESRTAAYINSPTLSKYSNNLDRHDLNSFIVLAFDGDIFCAGARLTPYYPELDNLLPGETPYFRYADFFPDLLEENYNFCELSRFIIQPEYRGMRKSIELINGLVNTSYQQLNMDYAFAITQKNQSELYRIAMSKNANVGFVTTEIEVPAKPEYEDTKRVLSYLWNQQTTDILTPKSPGEKS